VNQEIRKRWSAACRSGKRQGHDWLRQQNDEFCCLGILSQEAADAGVIPQPERGINTDMIQHYIYAGCTDYLPEAVSEWAGLKRDDPVIELPALDGEDPEIVTMSQLNDVHCLTLPQIADMIDYFLGKPDVS
jgi:hypothetical protein